MPRIRQIKPEAWRRRKVGERSLEAQNLWIKLITLADDAGRFPADIGTIAGHGFPHQLQHVPSIQGWLDELASVGLVVLYERDGDPYGVIPKFRVHQYVNKPTQSRLPEPPKDVQGAFRYDSEISPVAVVEDYGSPTVEQAKTPISRDLPEPSGSTTALDHGPWTMGHGSRTSGGGAGARPENEPVYRCLQAAGFSADEIEIDRSSIDAAVIQRQPPADMDWDALGQRIERLRREGKIEASRPSAALKFVFNGFTGLPRLGHTGLFSATGVQSSHAAEMAAKYGGIG